MERLQRVMAARGSGSRRDAEALIVQGRVTVDGQRVTELGTRVDPVRASIRVDGRELRAQRDRTIILHKPAGYITTVKDERDRWTVMDLVDVRERVYPVGRLDRDTEGLLVLTNNGELANRIMHPRYRLTKEYHVLTTIRPDDRTMHRVREGVLVDGQVIRPDEFRLLRETREGIWLTISLHVGMFHVIRRMMEAVKIPVERLTRVRVGPLVLEGIAKGTWRDLTPGEAASLAEAVHLDESAPPMARPARPRARVDAIGRPEGRTTVMPVAANRPAPERTFGLRPKARPAFSNDETVRLVGEGPRDNPGYRGRDTGRDHDPAGDRAVASGPFRGGPFATRRPPEASGDDAGPRGRDVGRGPVRPERGGRGPGRSPGAGQRRDENRGPRRDIRADGAHPDQITSGRRSRGMAPDWRGRGAGPERGEERVETRDRPGRSDGPGMERGERPPKGFPTGGRRAGRMTRPDRMGRPDPSGRRATGVPRTGPRRDPASSPRGDGSRGPTRPGEARPASRPGRVGPGGGGEDRGTGRERRERRERPQPSGRPDRGEGPERGERTLVAPGRGGRERGPVVNRRDRFGPRPERGDRMTPRDEERQEQREHDRHEPRSPEGDHDRRPRRGRKEHRRAGTG